MTGIRRLLHSFRARRVARRLARTESVSFNAFCNEGPVDQYPTTKESSLCKPPKFDHGNHNESAEFNPRDVTILECSRPCIVTVLLLLLLLAVFLILPTIYLLYCFGVLHVNQQKHLTHTFALKEKDHYAPKLHDLFKINRIPAQPYKILPPPPPPNQSQCGIPLEARFDCYPEDGATKEKCEARGCCWFPRSAQSLKRIKRIRESVDVSYCFYPKNYESYKFVNVSKTDFGLIAFLKRNYRSAYPDDVETVKMIVKLETEDRLRIKILDPLHVRYEPPYPSVPIVDKAPTDFSYIFKYNISASGFKILRRSDEAIIFDAMNLQTMIFADQFIQFSSLLPSKNIYGLGEHRSSMKLSTEWKRFTMFNHDSIPTEDLNLYGMHPFYMNVENSTKAHGVFLLNSNAMEVILQPYPAITYRTIGGILDFYIVLGPSPRDVVRQYTEIIGRPFMPPYWGLGFHLCRFGYKTLNETRKVMQRNIDAGIPLDTQWNDLDYMNNSNDFTYDKTNFKDLPKFVEELHKNGMHYIPLIDPGISASEVKGSYVPFDKGLAMDIFVKNSSGLPFVGKVWNRATTVWPDFTNPNSVDYWTSMLKILHDSVQFDGAWIDMNEPSNFLSGSFDGCPNNHLEHPPYLPAIDGGMLFYKTICMSANHTIGLHYDVHNLYGFSEAIITNFALAEIRGKRPMIISRSTFPGHGKYAGHWSGDVYSKWTDMRYSIPQLLSFSLFGIPLMGADICGFNGNATATLCNRWMQLGAFYPFSRNHNTDDGIEQDPVALGPDVIESSKKALSIRYSMLPYLYTLFWAAHTRGDTVARPLFFEFPNDWITYDIDKQFLWGSALMIIPVLTENQVSVSCYVPAAIWYDFYTFKMLNVSEGKTMEMAAPLDTIPLLIRGGNIIPQQSALQTTTASRKTKFQLLVATNESQKAFGELYWDDGDSLNSAEERKYCLLEFTMDGQKLTSDVIHWGFEAPPNLGVVKVLGISAVTKVYVNKVDQPFDYNTINKYLLIKDLNVDLKKPMEVTWTY